MKPVTQIVLYRPGVDNLQSGPDAGWLDQLGVNLDLVLKKYAGEGLSLQTISPDSKNTAELPGKPVLLIPVMHTSYAASGKYLKFLGKIVADSSVTIEHFIRIDTSADDNEEMPDSVVNAASIELFESPEDSDQSQWIGEDSPFYWSRLLDLVAEIKTLTGHVAEAGVKGPGNIIYLAQTAPDMGGNRNTIKRELVEHGFRVVPDADLKVHKKDIKSHIQNLVDKSRMAIHLLGNSYGEAMKETGNSIAETQVQYITEYLETIEKDPAQFQQKNLDRLIWIDPEFNPVDSKQEELISKLKRNIESLHRTEIIQTPIELFKTLVINRLRRHDYQDSKPDKGEKTGGKLIYIIHARDDQKEASELSRGLSSGGLATGMLDFEKGQKQLLNDHKKYLKECDSAIVYYSNPNRMWLRSKVMDLLKAPGLGRARSLETRLILARGKDVLEDYSLPAEMSITREQDLSKAVSQLLKNLK